VTESRIEELSAEKSESQCALLIDSAFLWSGFPQVSAIFEGNHGGKSSFKTKHGKYEFAGNPFPYSSSMYVKLDLISKNVGEYNVRGGGGGVGVLFVIEFKRIYHLSYIHLGSSVCHPVCHPVCRPVVVAER
jgi:hypothetical protein